MLLWLRRQSLGASALWRYPYPLPLPSYIEFTLDLISMSTHRFVALCALFMCFVSVFISSSHNGLDISEHTLLSRLVRTLYICVVCLFLYLLHVNSRSRGFGTIWRRYSRLLCGLPTNHAQ